MVIQKSSLGKSALGIALLASLVFSLSGCGLIPVPKEQRYQYIDQLKEEIDLYGSGSVTSEEKFGDGFSSSTSNIIRIEGDSTFETLSEKLKGLAGSKCVNHGSKQLSCNLLLSGVSLSVDLSTDNSISPHMTYARITDRYNGKKEIAE